MGDEADQYAAQFDVSRDTATQRLKLQEKAVNISDGLRKRLGERFAGVWFDHEAGEFVVPLVSGSDWRSVDQEFKSRGLADSYRTSEARSTESELLKAQQRLYDEFSGLVGERYARMGIDTKMNAVVVELANGANAERRDRVHDRAAAEQTDVIVRDRPEDRFRDHESLCSFPSCDPPLRGGVWIEEFARPTWCTAGFKAYGPGAVKYILTAGHCARWGGLWQAAAPSLGAFRQIGYVSSWVYGTYGDYGFISVGSAGPSYWDTIPWLSEVIWWFVQNDVPIYGSGGYTYQGQYLCHTGIATYTTCGSVQYLNQTVTYNDGTELHGMTTIQGVACSGGDSGGPVFSNNYAYGVWSGGTVGSCSTGYFMDVARIMDASGTWVAAIA